MTVPFRHPYNQTAVDLASALQGTPRVKQEVHVLTRRYGGALGPRYTVLVDGEYYDCGQHILDKLQMGCSPAYLEIEPCEPEEEEDFD